MKHDAQAWTDYAEGIAFIGNSLLAPMSQTGTVGFEPGFWAGFPSFGDANVAEALRACEARAAEAQARAAEGGNPVQDVSVEYTRLFVGPPRPAAAPWETMYRPGSEGAAAGFGQATFEMRRLLREAGLEVSNENNQYADHIGIELLYLSVLCGRAAQGGEEEASACASFAEEHPLSWIGKLRQRVSEDSPNGYFDNLLALAEALLGSIRRTGGADAPPA